MDPCFNGKRLYENPEQVSRKVGVRVFLEDDSRLDLDVEVLKRRQSRWL